MDDAVSERWVDAEFASIPFGLMKFRDPDKTALEVEFIWNDAAGVTIARALKYERDRRTPWPGYPEVVSLTFKFTKPLGPQLHHATVVLKAFERRVRETTDIRPQVPKVRYDRKRYTRYLRLLDARREGATIGEMGRVLFRGKLDPRGSVKSALRAALGMVETGYRDLLLMDDK